MSGLKVSIGQHSDRGAKPSNQDFHGALTPDGHALALKGVAIALADGVSTSPVSHIAAETAVKSFLTDYYCTSDSWTVDTAAQRVIGATNGWLHAETRRARQHTDLDRGYVCTFAALVLKARTAHLFHVGDSRIFRLAGGSLEPLTEDHRVVIGGQGYLARALGMAPEVAIDYRALPLAEGDVFVLSTDGVHEFLSGPAIARIIAESAADLDAAARRIVAEALEAGSTDNVTLQIVRIDGLPEAGRADLAGAAHGLPPAPILEPPAEFEGYRILRQIHANNRSHIYHAVDAETGAAVALKVPALDLRADAELLRRFMMEEWIARRVDSPHLLKAAAATRERRHLYIVTEYIEGATLRQWMHDNPRPDPNAVRDILDQLVRGLRAMHRKAMVHGDLRPENVMIDRHGVVKIIDFGSTRVAGVVEAEGEGQGEEMLGALQYAAPERLTGEAATWRCDLFSLGVIAYEMLTGRLPYGPAAPRVRTRAAARALRYAPANREDRAVPAWIDGALRTAVHPDPARRYEALSEFVTDLRTPNPRFSAAVPLAERNPLRFWQGVSFCLLCAVLYLLTRLTG